MKIFFQILLISLLSSCLNPKDETTQKTIFLSKVDKNIENGRELFKNNCIYCHYTSSERLVGVGLCNIQKKRNLKWLFKFTTNPYKLYEQGDSVAIKMAKSGVLMPSFRFTTNQLENIYKYIESQKCKNEFNY